MKHFNEICLYRLHDPNSIVHVMMDIHVRGEKKNKPDYLIKLWTIVKHLGESKSFGQTSMQFTELLVNVFIEH